MEFQSTILTLPGYKSSGKRHWQTLWEQEFGFKRIEQTDWIEPCCNDWVETIDKEVLKYDPDNVIIVAHSIGCIALAYWAEHYNRYIKGALLVAPCDTEAATIPPGLVGFDPIPAIDLPFYSTLITSLNDPYISPERAEAIADCWGSQFVSIGNGGHINAESGFGKWRLGLDMLKHLDEVE